MLSMKNGILLLMFAAAVVSARAKIVTRAVEYKDGDVVLEGYLAYDDAKSAGGKLPGVLIVHEWWGLNDYVRGRAEKIAKLGYVAFALDMYGKGVLATDAKKAGELATPFYGKPLMASRAQAGLDQLLQTGLVDETRVAAIGYCFGGSTCQALAYTGAPLAGIVSFHGGLIPVPADAAARNKARFLICHGALDPTIKKEAFDAFVHSMNEGKFDYQLNIYAGAVHAFTNPDADAMAAANGLTGMIGYSPSADHRSWADMKLFLSDIFAKKKA